ncbi:response regulator [Thiohalocapsa marina]|nr:response regulator [Thiohalocapsa marina]
MPDQPTVPSPSEARARLELLTPRQHEVCELMSRGLLNKQIADQLGASINTIKTHRTAIFRKMGVHRTLELARMMDLLRREDEALDARAGVTSEEWPPPSARGDGRVRVLVVEDARTLRELIAGALSLRGFEVIALPNGEGLDQVLAEVPVDVALLDVMLGEDCEDGFALAARLRRRSRCGIIMITALGEIEHRIQGLEQGADAYLVKPIDFAELEAVIRSVLRRVGTAPG